MTQTIMFQGTGSDVGKSLLVAGLCRLLARRGVSVLPFKPQNMSNNAAVAADGGEIGRAQWLQAVAAGVAPSVHMNPVLLKPQSDTGSQVIVHGKVRMTTDAADYQTRRAGLMDAVLDSYRTLCARADVVLVEGAGSPAEINLRACDIANMGFARAVRCPVVLVGDIDRGGVIASLIGTYTVLPKADRALIRAFIINKFRGDVRLFDAGLRAITQKTGWHNIAVIPYFPALRQLPQEDALALDAPPLTQQGAVRIVALALPHIANFDDLDPLAQDPQVDFCWLKAGDILPVDTRMVIIPGSKATMADLAFIRAQGWDVDIKAHRRRGGHVMGLCGGYQMLGNHIHDPQHVESAQESVDGLGLLDVRTRFAGEKTVTPWQGCMIGSAIPVDGYEIHLGMSDGADCARPLFIAENGAKEGASSADGRVSGSYIHGVFANDAYRKAWLYALGASPSGDFAYRTHIDRLLDDWADVLEESLDIENLLDSRAV